MDGGEMVDVPVRAFLGAQMALDAGAQAAGAEGGADVHGESGGKMDCAQPSCCQLERLSQLEQEGVGSGIGWDHGVW